MNTELAARYRQLMRRISELSRGVRKVTLIAVSKTQPVEAIEALYSLGHRDFGENYAQELIDKASQLQSTCPGLRWHFIGHLQTNKVKAVLPFVHAIHSLDSERLAGEVDKRWRQHHSGDERLPCFLEVNIDGESSKAGVPPDSAPPLAGTIAESYGALKLEGLMAIPAAADAATVQKSFAALRELEHKCRPHTTGGLSMGMSGDFELAIPEGATHIRVGTALFGPRQTT